MSEKRFVLDEYGHINDTLQELIYDGGEDCVYMLKLLNTLNDENEQLKKENQRVLDCIDEKIQSARELLKMEIVWVLKNLKREIRE